MRKKRFPQSGFSLVELLIVLAIILILVSIIIPNYYNHIRPTTETAAIENLNALRNAEISYRNSKGKFATLEELAGAGHLQDQSITRPPYRKQGYEYSAVDVTADGYKIFAVPISPNSGTRSFCVDDGGTVMYGGDPNSNPPMLGTTANCSNTLP